MMKPCSSAAAFHSLEPWNSNQDFHYVPLISNSWFDLFWHRYYVIDSLERFLENEKRW